jgi:hypothetical protein
MRFSASIAFLFLAARTMSANADDFEPSDLNITNALIENGVDVSSIPALADLVARSPVKRCALAVRRLPPEV